MGNTSFSHCHLASRRTAMNSQPKDYQQQAVELAMRNSSPSALFNRAFARSRGMPVPFAIAPGPVACGDESGNYMWWTKHWRMGDDILLLTIITPMIFMGVMNKLPK